MALTDFLIDLYPELQGPIATQYDAFLYQLAESAFIFVEEQNKLVINTKTIKPRQTEETGLNLMTRLQLHCTIKETGG